MQHTLIPTCTPLSHLPFFLIIIITTLTSLFPSLHSLQLCPPFSCNPHHHDTIQFPFHVPQNQSSRCGYPGFDLKCTQGQDYHTLLTLPSTPNSPYIVRGIDYTDQLIFLSDKNQCLPQNILKHSKNTKNLNLTSNLRNSPYSWGPDVNSYSFLNCTSASKTPSELPRNTANVSCMSGSNYTVVAALGSVAEGELVRGGECHVIERAVMSLWWPDIGFGFYPVDLSDVFLQLSWDVPQCGDCVLRGGSCGFVSDQGLAVGCIISSAASGLPKSAKYGLILGVGIPGLVCMVGLTFYISGRARARNQNRRQANLEASPSIFPQPVVVTLGLDRPTIESYPKTILGESKRLPKPSDGTCPICLSEYQSKETLRSIPECNHYFHADCIDEWLRLNGTCPLCRNSPQKASSES